MNSNSTQENIVSGLVNAKDAVVNTISQTMYPEQQQTSSSSSSSSSCPAPPRGVPPSEECHSGKVAYEDKTLTGKLSENLENIQSSFSSLRRPSLEALINLQTEGIPQPPHGQAPSQTNPLGVVADQDKPLLTRVSESLPTMPALPLPTLPLPSWSDSRQEIYAFYESFPQSLADSVNQAKAAVGFTTPRGTAVPNPPHGVPPSDNGNGFVANQDKPIQVQLEENWEALRCEFLNLWSQSKRKLGWNWIQPGSVPEPPRGLAPTNQNGNGVVDGRDKTLFTNLDEAVTQFRDVAQRNVDDTVRTLQGYISVANPPLNEAGAPQPPRGVPPSEDMHLGVVAQEDKSFQQKVGEAWEQVKDVVNNRVISEKPNSYVIGNASTLTAGEL